MVHRFLGGLSLLVGGIFAAITVLVLLPFLNNFNSSLLVLAAIFGIFSWVFLGIGWQLLHPPRPRPRPVDPRQAPADEEDEELPGPVLLRPIEPAGPTSPEAKDAVEHHLRAPRTL